MGQSVALFGVHIRRLRRAISLHYGHYASLSYYYPREQGEGIECVFHRLTHTTSKKKTPYRSRQDG